MISSYFSSRRRILRAISCGVALANFIVDMLLILADRLVGVKLLRLVGVSVFFTGVRDLGRDGMLKYKRREEISVLLGSLDDDVISLTNPLVSLC